MLNAAITGAYLLIDKLLRGSTISAVMSSMLSPVRAVMVVVVVLVLLLLLHTVGYVAVGHEAAMEADK
jgi:hypothetical protein